MNRIAVKFKKTDARAQTPRYATDGSGAFDIAALDGADIPPMFAATIETGLAFEIPPGHAMLIYSRSGHGFKHGIRLSNCVGLIDSDYRAEIKVKLHNDGGEPFFVEPGDRIAQAVIVPLPQTDFIEVAELSSTARGLGGFGSTGR